MPELHAAPSDTNAILLGSVVGLFAGTFFGGGIVALMGGYPLDVTLIVVLHTAVAMMLMGGWTAPCLLVRSEQDAAPGLAEGASALIEQRI